MNAPWRHIEVNNAAAYDEKMADRCGDGSPSEAISQGSDQIPRKKLCVVQDREENAGDRTSQGRGSSRSPMLNLDDKASPDDGDQLQETPFRKARVSVRARSEAPMVIGLSVTYCTCICITMWWLRD